MGHELPPFEFNKSEETSQTEIRLAHLAACIFRDITFEDGTDAWLTYELDGVTCHAEKI